MPDTKKLTSKETLANYSARLEAVLNTVIDGIITIDDAGTICSFNPSATRIFGYTPEEVIGRNVKMLMPEPYTSGHDGYIRNYLATGHGKVIGVGREVEALRKDGSIFPMELGINEMRISGQRMFVGSIRDISDRKRAEQMLRDSESKMQAIVNNTVDGLVTIDSMGKIETFNKACQDIFGYTAQEVVGMNVKILMPEPYHNEHDSYLENYHKTGDKKIIGIGREVKGKRKDGSVFPLDLSVSEVDVLGRKIYSGIIRDISERKNAEEEIMRSNEELERFAYIASHDLQEPLRMVANFTALLENEYGGKFDEQAMEYMRFIIDAAHRMQELVADLLEYSRIGYEEGGFSDIDCKAHTDLAISNLKDVIAEAGAAITVEDLPVVYANAVRFTRLMQNLVGNAIKYRTRGQAPAVHVRVRDSGQEWLFSVSDNGIGIRPEYQKQIFIIFKRLHNKKEYQGTGIGLAICKKIVESFGGTIWVESQPGEGSTFFFTVPKKENAREPA